MMQFTLMDDNTTIRVECDCGDAYFIRLLNLEDTPIALYYVHLGIYQPTAEELKRWDE